MDHLRKIVRLEPTQHAVESAHLLVTDYDADCLLWQIGSGESHHMSFAFYVGA